MGRKGSRLTEQRLVPFQAARHVAYPYDRPRALHWVPLCGLILVYTDLDTAGHGRPKTKYSPTIHCVYTRFYHIPEIAVLFYANRRVSLNLPSPKDRSSQPGASSAIQTLGTIYGVLCSYPRRRIMEGNQTYPAQSPGPALAPILSSPSTPNT